MPLMPLVMTSLAKVPSALVKGSPARGPGMRKAKPLMNVNPKVRAKSDTAPAKGM
jgi:hypothetical protein